MEQDVSIKELGIYSFLADFRVDRNKDRSCRNLLDRVRAFQPDIIFWQHPQDFPINHDLISAIRACGSSPLLAYHEADPFDHLYKPLDKTAKTLYAESDIFFTVALGMARRLFDKVKVHPHFYYSPSCVDRERFAVLPTNSKLPGSKYDAVMLGTIAKRFRLIRQPGSRQRVRLARGLTRLFGDRFAAFGRGWPSGTNCKGPFPYERQAEILQQSRMSIIWELYSEHTFYFSDRLPIALAAGIPFITSRHGGYDTLFSQTPGLFYVDTIEDALDTALYLKSLPDEEIAEMGGAARKWMLENLEARVVFRRAFEICRREWNLKRKAIEVITR
jgi:glycosyltransferase involved in cell wall biosynthesis